MKWHCLNKSLKSSFCYHQNFEKILFFRNWTKIPNNGVVKLLLCLIMLINQCSWLESHHQETFLKNDLSSWWGFTCEFSFFSSNLKLIWISILTCKKFRNYWGGEVIEILLCFIWKSTTKILSPPFFLPRLKKRWINCYF